MHGTKATLSDFKQAVDTFLTERDWHQFHNPKVDSMGAVVESGELLALFLFSKPGTGGQDVLLAKRESVEDELVDTLWWVVMSANGAKIDLAQAVRFKLGDTSDNGDKETTLSDLRDLVSQVADPRTVEAAAMNLSGKAMALMSLFFETSDETGWQLIQEKRKDVEGCLADILVAIVQFAKVASIDITVAFARKMEKNAEKYPVEKSKGKSTKYTDL